MESLILFSIFFLASLSSPSTSSIVFTHCHLCSLLRSICRSPERNPCVWCSICLGVQPMNWGADHPRGHQQRGFSWELCIRVTELWDDPSKSAVTGNDGSYSYHSYFRDLDWNSSDFFNLSLLSPISLQHQREDPNSGVDNAYAYAIGKCHQMVEGPKIMLSFYVTFWNLSCLGGQVDIESY